MPGGISDPAGTEWIRHGRRRRTVNVFNVLIIQPEEPAAIGRDELLVLYDAVGWSAYTRSPETLLRGIAGSHRVVTARRDARLVGLARSLSDGATIAYIQDILVHPDEQGAQIGTRMTRHLLRAYRDLRQRVLLTDTDPRQRAFYEELGFTEVHDHDPPLRAFVRLE